MFMASVEEILPKSRTKCNDVRLLIHKYLLIPSSMFNAWSLQQGIAEIRRHVVIDTFVEGSLRAKAKKELVDELILMAQPE